MPISDASGAPGSGEAPRSGEKKAESKFELIAELGRGGMATVYLARAKSRPERLIVLKQLRSDLADNPEFLAMFLEEARLAGKLHHPNIVETYEVGQDGDTYYIEMEYLNGLSLQAVLAKVGWRGALTFPLQVYVLIEALRGLERAYTQRDDDGAPLNIVHRDVSPPNIIITFDGQVRLVDFGIAKAANSNVETRTGLIKGKLTYMAPEQAASGDVDSRTDIYSIGVMLWQAAAGKRRWKGVENTEVLRRLHAGKVAEAPGAKANGLPESVDEIVLKAIAAEPEDRYASASKMGAALEKLLASMNATATRTMLGEFMSTQFDTERKHARRVLDARLEELDGVPSPDDKESVTAVRASLPRSSDDKVTRRSSPRRQETVEKSADGAGVVKSRANDRDNTESKMTKSGPITIVAAKGRRSYAIPIGVVGVTLAAALCYLALRHRNVPAVAMVAAAPPVASQNSPSDAQPTSTFASAAIATTPPSQSPVDAPAHSMPEEGRGHHRHNHPPSAPTQAPTVAPAAAVAPAPSPQTATIAPVAQPQPVATATSDTPSMDRQDPWQEKSRVDKADPWAK